MAHIASSASATSPTVWAVLLAAGSGSRLAAAGVDTPKQFLEHRGQPLFWRSVQTLAATPLVRGLVVVFPQQLLEHGAHLLETLAHESGLAMPTRVVAGGPRRQDSVANGLAALPPERNQCDVVLVHDAARPFLTPSLTTRLLEAVCDVTPPPDAAIPALPVTDTIKTRSEETPDHVEATLDRSRLAAVQTPQAFRRDVLEQAHRHAVAHGLAATDDASLVEACGGVVRLVPGDPANVKITNPEDLALLADATPPLLPVTGFGYDVHKYGVGRPMVLGGVPIPGAPEVVAHSDGDVLLHAVADALLGCLGQGDIGQRFPDSDPRFEGMESGLFVREILEDCRRAGLALLHADVTIIAQIPKVSPHRDAIAKRLANLLALPRQNVAVKATTEEGLGFTGEKKGVKAVAVVTALRPGVIAPQWRAPSPPNTQPE